MKDMNEFKKSVYEKAEKAEEARRQRMKTITQIGSVAAAVAIVFISIFAVIKPGFSYGKQSAEETHGEARFASNIYAVINENGEVEKFVEIDEYGAVNYIDMTELYRNGGIDVSANYSDSSPEKTACGAKEGASDTAKNYARFDYDNISYSCNVITQDELEELIKNSSGAHTSEEIDQTLHVAATTTTPALTKIEATDFCTLVEQTSLGEVFTTTTAATGKNGTVFASTPIEATIPGDTAEAELPSVTCAAFGDGAEEVSSYVIAYSSDDFTRWLQVRKIELPTVEFGEKDRVLSKFVYSSDFKPFVAFIVTNENKQGELAITKFESMDGTLTFLYRFEGNENAVGDGETFMIFAFLPDGITDIVFEKESGEGR